jgi:hypothetical protein
MRKSKFIQMNSTLILIFARMNVPIFVNLRHFTPRREIEWRGIRPMSRLL